MTTRHQDLLIRFAFVGLVLVGVPVLEHGQLRRGPVDLEDVSVTKKSPERKRERMDREAAATSDIIAILESLMSWRATRRVLFAVLMRQWPRASAVLIYSETGQAQLNEAML